ncbi:MAG: response regulator [Saprospiraceae bacterium]
MHKRLSGLGAKADILFIEDDYSYARLVEIWLSESDLLHFTLTNATSLSAGIQMLEAKKTYDAILLDLSLPDSNGFETLEKMINRFPNHNIIVLTGRMDVALGMQAVKSGAQDFLIKGEFGSKELAKSLLYSIERSSILSRLEEAQHIAQVGHWECNSSESYFYASKEVYRIFGLEDERTFNCDDLMKGDTPFQILMEIEQEAKEKGEIRKDLLLERVDGEQRFVSLHCKPSHIKDDNYVFHGVIQDLTIRKQAEEMKRSHELAEQTAKVREQVIASVSHEMRTPMNAILGMSNLLQRTPLNAEQLSYVDSIHHSSELLLGIINDILQISELHHKVAHFDQQAFSLKALLFHLQEVMQDKLKEKALQFGTEIAVGIPEMIVGDKIRLSQILYNLVGNAIKFTDEGFVHLKIERVRQEGKSLRLKFSIKDTGIGVPAELWDSIFEPFTRVIYEDRIVEGIGLGLAITKQLVELQGGEIGLESKENNGSTFFFELNFGIYQSNDLGADISKENINLKEHLSFKVLIVEDHLMNQFVVKKTLQKQWKNIQITIANNGKEALQYLKNKAEYDIILMDLQMPIMDGYQTTAYIRNKMPKPICNIPILAMTAHTHISEEGKIREFGMNDYLLKPFDPQQLFEKIVNYLDKKQLDA